MALLTVVVKIFKFKLILVLSVVCKLQFTSINLMTPNYTLAATETKTPNITFKLSFHTKLRFYLKLIITIVGKIMLYLMTGT